MAFCLLCFLVITLGFLPTKMAAKGCISQLHLLADRQSEFLKCTVVKSVPIANSCEQCLHQHAGMLAVYKAFTGNCSEKYLNKNHLNIVYNTQKTLVEMWNIAFCDDCFDKGEQNNSTQTFNALESEFVTCVNNNITKACLKCQREYISLNGFYKKMEHQKSGKICFDIQDKMNATRLLWSKELQCCRRDFSITLFLIGSSIFGLLPLLFYFGMYAHTKRLERNHEVIDSTFNSGNQEAVASTSAGVSSGSIALDNPNEPSVSTRTNAVDNDVDIADIKKAQVNLAAEVQQEFSSIPRNTKSLISL